jgi:hypothetical protein
MVLHQVLHEDGCLLKERRVGGLAAERGEYAARSA